MDARRAGTESLQQMRAPMTTTLRPTDLLGLPEEEQRARILAFLESRNEPPNGEATRLNEAIAAYEHKYGMRSDEMCSRLDRGEIEEDDGICRWLILLKRRGRSIAAGETR